MWVVCCLSRQAYNVSVIMATCERRALVEGKTARKPCQYNVTRAKWPDNLWCDSLCSARGEKWRQGGSQEDIRRPKLDFIHLSQFASQLIGNDIPCSLHPKGWPCSPCR